MILVAVTIPAFSIARGPNDEWHRCQRDDQCVIVEGNCGVEWAANKRFARQSRENPPRADGPCSKPLEFHPVNTVAKCENNKCVLSPRGFYAGGTPIPYHDANSSDREDISFEVLGGDNCFMFSQMVPSKQEGDRFVEEPVELVINTGEEFVRLFDPKYQRMSCPDETSKLIPIVDFSRKAVLGLWASGSCAAAGFERRVTRDRTRKLITYSVTVVERVMACRGPGHESLNLIAIAKIPAGYKVAFERYPPTPSGGGAGGITITSVSSTTSLKGPDPFTVTAINGVGVGSSATPGTAPPASTTPPNAFINAIDGGDTKTVLDDLAKGVNVNQQDNIWGYTPLIHSVMNGSAKPAIVAALLTHGANLNLQAGPSGGFTALMFAAGVGTNGVDVEIIKTLLKNGANPNLKTKFGYTALMYASNRSEVVAALLENGADPNMSNLRGETALSMARRANNADVVSALLKAGAKH